MVSCRSGPIVDVQWLFLSNRSTLQCCSLAIIGTAACAPLEDGLTCFYSDGRLRLAPLVASGSTFVHDRKRKTTSSWSLLHDSIYQFAQHHVCYCDIFRHILWLAVCWGAFSVIALQIFLVDSISCRGGWGGHMSLWKLDLYRQWIYLAVFPQRWPASSSHT